VATSYKSGDKFFIDPMKLLPMERFTQADKKPAGAPPSPPPSPPSRDASKAPLSRHVVVRSTRRLAHRRESEERSAWRTGPPRERSCMRPVW
jgi:hypothetical protein